MSRVFPLNPSLNQEITVGSKTFVWSGDRWQRSRVTSSDVTSSDAQTLVSAQSYADTQDAALSATITAAYEAYVDGQTADSATVTYVDDGDAVTLTAANTYTDARESAITTAYQSYADTAETDAVSTANANTDNLIGDGTVDGTSGNTVTDRIASAVSNLVDTAPETLNTLNELAAALGDDPNFATTVTNLVAGKADLSHTHSISDVTNLQSTLDGKAASSHTHAISEVTNLQTSLDDKVNKTNPTVNAASEAAYYVRNIYISNSDTPSGGNDGDLWIVYE